MRACGLILVALSSACASSLERGDEAFGAARWAAAAEAYAQAAPEDAAAARFRIALLHATPESPSFDPAQARAALEALREAHPSSPYGVAARHVLEGLARQEALEARLRAVDEALARCEEARARLDAERRAEVQYLEETTTRLEAERERLTAELRALREGQADRPLLEQQQERLRQLEADNARLARELEELKRIDLQR